MRSADTLVEYQGRSMRFKDAADAAGLLWVTVRTRVHVLGWSVERALSEPLHANHKKEVDPMIDQRFGRLRVVNRMSPGVYEYGGGAHYLCVCDCGTPVAVRGVELRRGGVKSCGCLRREFGRRWIATRQAQSGAQ